MNGNNQPLVALFVHTIASHPSQNVLLNERGWLCPVPLVSLNLLYPSTPGLEVWVEVFGKEALLLLWPFPACDCLDPHHSQLSQTPQGGLESCE